ncbi:MIP family channel proteins [Rodentibacter pneumotropicus]|uniref:MIP family channel proteins n=1 Tax=Rodentibacter pneumotropicus TaxID=758 RepID=A0A448MIL6_9PAST|nr:MIP family channel proteins [Rodentibacter pneumotropicus]
MPGTTKATPIGLGSIGALPVAILVWAIGLSLGGTTGYALNPARDFGPRLTLGLSSAAN